MIIEMEKQVTCFGVSERLKGLGVRQDSHFFWIKHTKNKGTEHENEQTPFLVDYREDDGNDGKYEICYFAAYTVAELGILLLPNYCVIEKKYENGLILFLISFNGEQLDCIQKCEADARGEALVYAIDKGYIKPKDL
jgi:hypothetical protein